MVGFGISGVEPLGSATTVLPQLTGRRGLKLPSTNYVDWKYILSCDN
jgi:hypothetical protein